MLLAQRVERLTRTRADAVDAQALEVRRIERDLYDGAQARLIAVGLTLDAIEQLLDTDPAAARHLVAQARETSATALADLRDLARGIHPPVLSERGLGDAVRALALDAVVPTEVPGDPQLVDAATREATAIRSGPADTAVAVTWAPGGEWLAIGDTRGGVRLWNRDTTRTLAAVDAHATRVVALAWSADGEHLASGGNEGEVRLWRVGAAGDPLPIQLIACLRINPFGHLAWAGPGLVAQGPSGLVFMDLVHTKRIGT
jgi:hypothetical protein